MIYQGHLKIHTPTPADDLLVLSTQDQLGLDFDDATQFVATTKLRI